MRSTEFGFQGEDVKNVDAIIEAIRELVSLCCGSLYILFLCI